MDEKGTMPALMLAVAVIVLLAVATANIAQGAHDHAVELTENTSDNVEREAVDSFVVKFTPMIVLIGLAVAGFAIAIGLVEGW